MAELPDTSVDLILTSPPYEDARHYSNDMRDLGNYTGEDYLRLLTVVLAECRRVLKPTGSLFLNFQGMMRDGQYSLLESRIPLVAVNDLGLIFVQPHYWFKSNAHPTNAPRNLKHSTEIIWHFAKSDQYRVYKDAIREPSYWAERDQRREKYHPHGKDPGNGFWTLQEQLRTAKDPGDSIFVGKKSQDQSTIHPAKMPEELARRFILYGSYTGGLVLDPFAGSGTTLACAKALGRHYVGYELNPTYAELSRSRLAEIKIRERGSKTMDQEKRLFDIDELSAYLSIPKATLYTKVHKKDIPFVKIGRSVRFDKVQIDNWVGSLQSPAQSST